MCEISQVCHKYEHNGCDRIVSMIFVDYLSYTVVLMWSSIYGIVWYDYNITQ